MATPFLFLAGILLGGLLVRAAMLAAWRRGVSPNSPDEQYAAAQRAVMRHFRRHDTVNLAGMERLMDITAVTAMHYLDRMRRDGLIKAHGHRGTGAFYTRP